jgi:hypothetical protein
MAISSGRSAICKMETRIVVIATDYRIRSAFSAALA